MGSCRGQEPRYSNSACPPHLTSPASPHPPPPPVPEKKRQSATTSVEEDITSARLACAGNDTSSKRRRIIAIGREGMSHEACSYPFFAMRTVSGQGPSSAFDARMCRKLH